MAFNPDKRYALRMLHWATIISTVLLATSCGTEDGSSTLGIECMTPATYCDEATDTLVDCAGFGMVERYPCEDICARQGKISRGCADVPHPTDEDWDATCFCRKR